MPDTIDSLRHHDTIMLKYGRHQQIDHWQFQEGERMVAPPIQARYFFSSIQSTIDAALSGLGVAYILDKSLVQQEVKRGELVIIHPEWGVSQGDILLYYPKSKVTAKLRALLQVIADDA